MIKKILIVLSILLMLVTSIHNIQAEETSDSTSESVKPIDTSSIFWWSFIYTWDSDSTTWDATTTNFLKTVITKLTVWIWFTALFIMTIGWAYMIFSNWQDELLKKWKSIFMAWIIWIIIALASWLIMRVVIYLLYN